MHDKKDWKDNAQNVGNVFLRGSVHGCICFSFKKYVSVFFEVSYNKYLYL